MDMIFKIQWPGGKLIKEGDKKLGKQPLSLGRTSYMVCSTQFTVHFIYLSLFST